MDICYKLDYEKITEYITAKAPFQKVVLFYDASSNLEVVERLVKSIKDKAILFECNMENRCDMNAIINDGVRLVVSCVSDNNYLKIKKCLTSYVFIIDMYYGNFASFRLVDNQGLLLLLSKEYDYTIEFLLQANYLVESKFYDILSYKNYGQADERLDEQINILKKCREVADVDFSAPFYVKANKSFGRYFDDFDMININVFLYISLLGYKYLFLSIKNKNYVLTDIYKDYINDYENLNIAYEILNNERLNYVLNNYADTMLEMIDKILKQVNLLNLKNNLKINNILKIIKNKFKLIKKDNLLKISYLYGVFNSI